MDSATLLIAVLKGVGQIMFMESPITGLLFLAGLFVASRRAAMGAFIGSLAGMLAAFLLGAPEAGIAAGLFGFNGALCGIAFSGAYFKASNAGAYILLSAAASSLLFLVMGSLLAPWGVSPLTAPFVISTWLFLLIGESLGHVKMPSAAKERGALRVVPMLLRGVSKVMLIDNWLTGILFFAGLTLATAYYSAYPLYLAGGVAIAGALVGSGAAWLIRAPKDRINSGSFGANAVLAIVALGGVFLPFTLASFLFAVVGAALSSVVLLPMLRQDKLPALTAPFVIATWLVLIAIKLMSLSLN